MLIVTPDFFHMINIISFARQIKHVLSDYDHY